MRKAGVRPGEVKARLLKATEDLIREQGSSAVSLREVARRAGVSHGAPAHYFKNKAGLLSSFAAAGLMELKEAFFASIEHYEARTGKEIMRAIGIAYVAYAAEHPGWFDVMVRRDLIDKSAPEFKEGTDSTFAVLRDTVGACVREGSIEPENAQHLAVLCWSVVFGLIALWTSGVLEARMGVTDVRGLSEESLTFYLDRMLPKDPLKPLGPQPDEG